MDSLASIVSATIRTSETVDPRPASIRSLTHCLLAYMSQWSFRIVRKVILPASTWSGFRQLCREASLQGSCQNHPIHSLKLFYEVIAASSLSSESPSICHCASFCSKPNCQKRLSRWIALFKPSLTDIMSAILAFSCRPIKPTS